MGYVYCCIQQTLLAVLGVVRFAFRDFLCDSVNLNSELRLFDTSETGLGP
jgi:hypothetical protein